jgi:hypothetical protein
LRSIEARKNITYDLHIGRGWCIEWARPIDRRNHDIGSRGHIRGARCVEGRRDHVR